MSCIYLSQGFVIYPHRCCHDATHHSSLTTRTYAIALGAEFGNRARAYTLSPRANYVYSAHHQNWPHPRHVGLIFDTALQHAVGLCISGGSDWSCVCDGRLSGAHRAAEGKIFAEVKNSGYIPEAFVIAEAEKAGFKLVASSAINNNTKDTKDYAKGVWTLPPTFAEGEKDRAKYIAIGESDRFTLRFVKPKK